MIMVGEVHTNLLQHSAAVSGDFAAELLRLVTGEKVRRSERPIAYAASPLVLYGIDCNLPSSNSAKVRGVGTTKSRAILTGGHLAQGSSFAAVIPGVHRRRMPWSHYLANPGVIETIGKADFTNLAHGFTGHAETTATGSTLDLSAICQRTLDKVQNSAKLNRGAKFGTARTSLRWVADEATDQFSFTIEDQSRRTARIPAGIGDLNALAGLFEDIAAHDWLLTTVLRFIDKARIGSEGSNAMRHLRPAIDHMLHLWMPAARLDPATTALWDELERRPGFSRQWNTLTARIRDQMMLATIASMGRTAEATASQRGLATSEVRVGSART